MSRRSRLAAFAAATAALIALSGCAASTSEGETDAPAASDAFPVTIEHAFGETVIESEPQRVLTLGWGSGDAVLALGVVPVGMEAQNYGGDENGVLPWAADALAEMGAETPLIFPATTDAPAYEEIAEAAPDLILATYSGITEEQYDLLSEIAPVVAYPELPWSTPWRDVISITGSALGKTAAADDVLANIDALVAEKAAEHPEFEGKTVAATFDVGGTFYVYKPADPRVEFLLDLGLENAPAVDALSNGDSTFFYTLSYEKLDELDSDLLIAYAETEEVGDIFASQPYAQSIPAVANGGLVAVNGASLVASVSPPTAFSLPWGIDSFVDAISGALK
ncbi:iron-siderophore ABC transporter substrate-binding protein [Salinibacterium sp. NSLL150]|uniref:iron-siderophore ABC transporter substrate-binding protein n=1 Tax=unclassified Salinibacterium TaxID=2632331 RepID=UPI0018CD0FFB|nr:MULTISPECIES: iron-siderophore ABC transporter substrate-binding protein [unclassified Salinibacterium]MBH0098077.1 iron-siderophore ABC transporter substrate-binding protein [Salinibacterium sp. NSLL35]MBH0100832.1 iron-siderophore ABC transporter substrate-binding protein [Salinibacterium sp. NSLL150]MBH0103591.1 iron-siderophore ABC transporter substrate-binding protein [Salinibacterium sp. NSLL16]MBH0106352.1 iron-siderophore ABC transporter substrate-binding protein [Salinibacterium sp.